MEEGKCFGAMERELSCGALCEQIQLSCEKHRLVIVTNEERVKENGSTIF